MLMSPQLPPAQREVINLNVGRRWAEPCELGHTSSPPPHQTVVETALAPMTPTQKLADFEINDPSNDPYLRYLYSPRRSGGVRHRRWLARDVLVTGRFLCRLVGAGRLRD
jgi:hypothetical protein